MPVIAWILISLVSATPFLIPFFQQEKEKGVVELLGPKEAGALTTNFLLFAVFGIVIIFMFAIATKRRVQLRSLERG